ncbi:MAG: cation:proton antiporter [Clostridia bacterium]|nr:cation:proton antiporter [Clostridia bacterium]
MEKYRFLLDLALILISTKLLGMLTRRIQLPQVVGALLAGLILGPACLGLISRTGFIENISEIGVIVLMFSAGLETDISELKKSGGAYFVIALFGVAVPLVSGFLLASVFKISDNFIENLFVGVILTATSVSISVETLRELGKLSTRTGSAILGAALIDDVIGLIVLTVVSSFADKNVNVLLTLAKIAGFVGFCALLAVLIRKVLKPWIDKYRKDLRRFAVFAFSICLFTAFISEAVFGISDITGAFVAGLLLSDTKHTPYVLNRMNGASFLLLSPVFFASVGLRVEVHSMTLTLLFFTIALIIVGCTSKIVGCYTAARLCHYTRLQSKKIGVGMMARSEVALIMATKGAAMGIVAPATIASVIIMVISSTIITPVSLKLIYKKQASMEANEESSLVARHEAKHKIEEAAQTAYKHS